MGLRKDVVDCIDPYRGNGSKENHELQASRAIGFAEFLESNAIPGHRRPRSLGQVGTWHVIEFWKANRSKAYATNYSYWLALCQLWTRSNKPGTPPKPWKETLRD